MDDAIIRGMKCIDAIYNQMHIICRFRGFYVIKFYNVFYINTLVRKSTKKS